MALPLFTVMLLSLQEWVDDLLLSSSLIEGRAHPDSVYFAQIGPPSMNQDQEE